LMYRPSICASAKNYRNVTSFAKSARLQDSFWNSSKERFPCVSIFAWSRSLKAFYAPKRTGLIFTLITGNVFPHLDFHSINSSYTDRAALNKSPPP
jgi:hypothetical protein